MSDPLDAARYAPQVIQPGDIVRVGAHHKLCEVMPDYELRPLTRRERWLHRLGLLRSR